MDSLRTHVEAITTSQVVQEQLAQAGNAAAQILHTLAEADLAKTQAQMSPRDVYLTTPSTEQRILDALYIMNDNILYLTEVIRNK